jgi:hypothetical protein
MFIILLNAIRRVVAKGFKQFYGLDYKDTFSHIVKHAIVRQFISLIVYRSHPPTA